MTCTCFTTTPPPRPYVSRPNPAFEAWVERHAIELCNAAPMHIDAWPCLRHLHQARQAGLALARDRY